MDKYNDSDGPVRLEIGALGAVGPTRIAGSGLIYNRSLVVSEEDIARWKNVKQRSLLIARSGDLVSFLDFHK